MSVGVCVPPLEHVCVDVNVLPIPKDPSLYVYERMLGEYWLEITSTSHDQTIVNYTYKPTQSSTNRIILPRKMAAVLWLTLRMS